MYQLPTDPKQLKRVEELLKGVLDKITILEAARDAFNAVKKQNFAILKEEFEITSAEANQLIKNLNISETEFDESCNQRTELEIAVEKLKNARTIK